jgi:hypothetical protein
MEEMKSSFGIKITFLDHYRITKAIPNIWLEQIEYKVTCPYSVRRPLALKYVLKTKKVAVNYAKYSTITMILFQ